MSRGLFFRPRARYIFSMPTIDNKKNNDKFLEVFKENFEDHHLSHKNEIQILENQKRIEDKLDMLLNSRGNADVDWGSI